MTHREPAADPSEVADAVAVWHNGPAFFTQTGPSTALTSENSARVAFRGLNDDARTFLRYPLIQPAAHFSDAMMACQYEDSLVAATRSGRPGMRLQALVLLMRVRSPSSTTAQWQAIVDLQRIDGNAVWSNLLAELQNCFSPEAIQKTLSEFPQRSEFGRPPAEYAWAVRAAGTTQLTAALPTLRQLSRKQNIEISLAAEQSLEEVGGPAADEALAYCVAGWRYNADQRAADALLTRNRELLRRTLHESRPPAEAEYLKGIYLARCDDADAVPILCRTVPKYQIIDREMFSQIARLARREDLAAVLALPSQVRPDQLSKARETAEAVRRRLALADVK